MSLLASPKYPKIKLGICFPVAYPGIPAITDFSSFNTTIAPRTLDGFMVFDTLESGTANWTSYIGWQTSLGMTQVTYQMETSSHTLNAYAAGTFDANLIAIANTVKTYTGTLYLVLCSEFNGTWNSYGNGSETATQFIAGWQHVVTVFRTAGATNVKWVWCPNSWSHGEAAAPTTWYPGDTYVDVVGLDGFMNTGSGGAETPESIFLADYGSITALAPGKPFCLGSIGCSADSRLSSMGGKAGWFNLLFSLISASMPRLVLMNYWQQVTTGNTQGDCTIDSSGTDSAAKAAFVAGVNSQPFV